MDEMTNTAAVVEDTTPQTETVEGAAPEVDPTPAETPATEQPTGTTPEADSGAENPQAPVEPFLTAQFNHKDVDLTREQTLAYAQKGMKYDAERPMMDDLALMAAAQGMTVAEYINSLKQADEQSVREAKLAITGGDVDAAEILVQAELAKRREALNLRARQEQETAEAAEKSTLDRLAGEFGELKQLVPELTDWDNVPKAVIEDAVKNNRNLTDAYLRYQHSEGVKIEQNRAAQAAAAAATVGSQADKPPAGGDPAIAQIDAALRSVFG